MIDGRLVTLLIPAVGGQGGGVLSEWIIEAAFADGLVGHGTSIPGVAQRTGSTSYYVEVFTGDEAEAPTFSLYPVPGALDVLLAPELLEVGRAIELGFASPACTTIIASTHRLYSIHERISTSGSIYPSSEVLDAARAFSKRLVAFDALALAREHGTEANAILLGALAGCGVLPIRPDAYRAAIEKKGVAVKANLAGFELGVARARADVAGRVGAGWREHGPSGEAPREPFPLLTGSGLDASRERVSEPRPDPARDTSDALVADLPEPVRPIAAVAVARLVDYQDHRYAARYVERLRPFLGPGADLELARIVARWLAVWMTYEDAIRVADLKTRLSRFERIRGEARSPDAEVVVTDYLKPDLDEIYGVLPYRLVRGFAAWAERRWPHARPALGQHVKTTSVNGYLRLWLLARCRRLRPISYRAHHEHARMERWLTTVRQCAGVSTELAREVARAAQLVKGYGDVRRRMTAVFDDLLASVTRAMELGRGGDAAVASALATRYRVLALRGPDGEREAASIARDVLARLEAGDRAGALTALTL